MALPRIVIGQPVRGHDLWGRKREIDEIWKALETSSVLLSAPRRFGKTSIMLALEDHPREGWRAFYLDTEWIKDPEDFVAELMASLIEKDKSKRLFNGLKKILGKTVGRVKELEFAQFKLILRESLQADWQDKGKELIKLLKDVDHRTILMVDELPLLILKISKKSNDQAEDFLYWLRGLRHIPELQDKVRWVIGGSIGIEKVLQRVGAGTKAINDLYIMKIREFSREEAQGFITAILKKELNLDELPAELTEIFLKIIEVPIPYFLQILVRETLNEMEKRGEESISEEIVQHAYQEGVLACYNRTYFEHYYERLRDYYDQASLKAASALLSELAHKGSMHRRELLNTYIRVTQGEGTEEDFNYLLSDLENDFYIVHDEDKYRFATKVLRDWWLRYHRV